MKKLTLIFLVCLVPFVLTGCEELVDKQSGVDAFYSGNYDKAIEIFKSCVDNEGDEGELATYCSFFLGRTYYEKGQKQEAIKYLKRAIDVYKKGMHVNKLDAAWYYWLGLAYDDTDQHRDAIENLRKAAELSPEDSERERIFDWAYRMFSRYVADKIKNAYLPQIPPKSACYFRLANAYFGNGQYQEAVDSYKKAIQLDPKAPHFYVMLGNTYRVMQKYNEAIENVKRAIEIDPNDDFAYGVMALIYTDMKRYDEAISAYKKAIDIAPKETKESYYRNLAHIYLLNKEDFNEALNVLKIAPYSLKISEALLNTYLAMGRFDDAIRETIKQIDALSFTGIGATISITEGIPVVKSLEKSGPSQRIGIKVGDKIIKINGQSIEGWNINKVVENLRGTEGTPVTLTIQREGVDKPFEKTITREKIIYKAAAPYYGLRSLIYSIKGQAEEAKKDAQMAYNLNSEAGYANSAMAFANVKEGKYKDAIQLLGDSKVYFDRLIESIAYARMGDFKKSVKVYAMIPQDYLTTKDAFRKHFISMAQESLSPYIQEAKLLATSYELKGQLREALNEYATLLKISGERESKEILKKVANLFKRNPSLMELPEDARRYALRAEAMTGEGKFEDAIKEYKKAIEISPFAPHLYKAIALNYAGLKEYKEAIENIKMYLELYPDAPDARQAKDEIYKWEAIMEKEGK